MSETRKRGRPSAADIQKEIDEQNNREIEIYGKREQRLDEIDVRYGGPGFEYNRNAVEGQILGILQNVGRERVEIGRLLLLMKEHEAHGHFMSRVEQIGIPYRAASAMMRAAVVAESMGLLPPLYGGGNSNLPTSVNLRGIPAMSKLVELASLEDDELQELGEGGTVAGLHLDDIERMSVREVRAALRAEKENRRSEVKVREEIIAKKEQMISDLERQLRGQPPVSQAEINAQQLKALSNEMIAHCYGIRGQIRALSEIIDRARSLPNVDPITLYEWAERVVDDATAAVMDEWEDVMAPLDTITPKNEESPDVRIVD